jgi:ParB/RepB/Spo0J family partition protein
VTAALKVVKDRAHDIPLECLHESPFNKRRNFGDLDELADSFRSVGVLQDVLARPHPEKEGEYELVFGHRRFRAAKLAELVAIPAKVKTLTDEQVCDAIIIENGQRENIHPLEEAETFEQSMRVQRLSAEDLAAKIGKSRSYVFGRLKLLNLCEKARQAFADDQISASIALYIARIPSEKLQDEALDEIVDGYGDDDPMGAREARRFIEQRYMLRLVDAPFDLSAADLVEGAGPCTTCPKRTGNQPELFADVQSRDVCTDTACFASKKTAHSQLLLDKARAEGKKVLVDKAAEKAINDSYRTWDPAAEYVAIDDECKADDKAPKPRPYREILKGTTIETVTAVDREGIMHELARRQDVAQALKGKGVELEVESPGKRSKGNASKNSVDDWRREQELKEARRVAVTAAVVAAAQKKRPTGAPFWRFLACALIQANYEEVSAEICGRRGIEPTGKKDGGPDYEAALRLVIAKMNEAEARAVCIELVVADDIGGDNSALDEAAKFYKVDAKKIGTAAVAQFKSAEKAKAPAKTAAKAKRGAK